MKKVFGWIKRFADNVLNIITNILLPAYSFMLFILDLVPINFRDMIIELLFKQHAAKVKNIFLNLKKFEEWLMIAGRTAEKVKSELESKTK